MNPFTVLGLPETATFDEIRKRYKELAIQHHPDKGGDAEKFKEIAGAYELIGSDVKLKQYRSGVSAGNMQWDATFDSIFKDFFGRGTGPSQAKKVSYVTLNISLEDSFRGANKKFMYRTAQSCGHCGGLGATAFHKNGQPRTICARCQGAGSTAQLNEAEIEIPRSIQDNDTVVASLGDVYVTFRILPHPVFERRGVDVYSELEIPLVKVFDGSSLIVNTLHGCVEVAVPRCLQNDQFLRIRQKGFYDSRKGGYGDHIIRLKVAIPKLSDDDCNKIVECLNGIEKKESTPT
jgi:molecular chaperone DnaJ